MDARILIVGAGIAGLALGRALALRGFTPEIVERAAAWPTAGAGLYVPGNGVRAVAALGLTDALMARAVRVSHQRLMDHQGRLLAEVDLSRVWGQVGACVGIRRVDFHRMLLDGAAGVPVRLASTVKEVTQTAEDVSVQFDDGTRGVYDVVIGADGIHSSIRRLAFGEVRPRDVGQASWRFVAGDRCGITSWTAMLGRDRAFLMLPVGSHELYCYADLMSRPSEQYAPPSMSGEGVPAANRDRERLRTLFRDFSEPVPRLLSLLDRTDPIHAARIEEVSMDRAVAGRVVLVGDAAHAASPNMAQGASMALEDALVLADALAEMESPVEALAAFEARRRPRVSWVQQRTHRRDRIRRLPAFVRNLALRAAGSALYKADYQPLLDAP